MEGNCLIRGNLALYQPMGRCPALPSVTLRPRSRVSDFAGLPAAAFTFFAALAEDNTKQWFLAHSETYRTCVDHPWRALVGSVAGRLAGVLPDLDAEVKTGHVLSRINLQWPRPGAAYRTGLRATFAAPEAGRRPGASLFVTLDASGVRAGAEIAAGTEEWGRVLERLDHGGPTPAAVCPLPLRWVVAGEVLDPADTAALSTRLRTVRRAGALRWSAEWGDDEALVGTPGFAEWVWEALHGALPLYLCATDVDGRTDGPVDAPVHPKPPAPTEAPSGTEGGRSSPAPVPEREADAAAASFTPVPSAPAELDRPVRGAGRRDPAQTGDALLMPPLPLSLQRALGARAGREGVSVEAFILFALTRAAGGAG